MKSQTSGTWVVIIANCVLAVLGVLQGVDWMHLASANAGWITALLAMANAAAHYLTGPNVAAIASK